MLGMNLDIKFTIMRKLCYSLDDSGIAKMSCTWRGSNCSPLQREHVLSNAFLSAESNTYFGSATDSCCRDVSAACQDSLSLLCSTPDKDERRKFKG